MLRNLLTYVCDYFLGRKKTKLIYLTLERQCTYPEKNTTYYKQDEKDQGFVEWQQHDLISWKVERISSDPLV